MRINGLNCCIVVNMGLLLTKFNWLKMKLPPCWQEHKRVMFLPHITLGTHVFLSIIQGSFKPYSPKPFGNKVTEEPSILHINLATLKISHGVLIKIPSQEVTLISSRIFSVAAHTLLSSLKENTIFDTFYYCAFIILHCFY